MGGLSGKTALVTGGAVRVGKAIALELAGRGARVVLHYGSSDDEARKAQHEMVSAGHEVELAQSDLANPAAVGRMIEDLDQRELHIDLLVNSAAVFPATPLPEATAQDWDDILAVNLRAPFLLSQALGLRMKERGGGLIINISDCSVRRPYRGYLPYLVSKAGLSAMTEILALELAPEVRVNAVAPGTVLLPPNADEKQAEQAANRPPLKRIGSPGDIARMVGFLAEEGGFITGQIFCVDGGASIRNECR